MHGLYHVSAEPIDKYALLRRVAAHYGKDTEIVPDSRVVIDRSLNSDRFRAETGYQPPAWDALIAAMKAFG
jgi:dTDP-4-dehydrorhamnose reductase